MSLGAIVKKQKSKASLLPIGELPKRFFKLLQDRDEFIIKKRFEGRTCPACGVKVPVGLTVCQKCLFDFRKQAGASN